CPVEAISQGKGDHQEIDQSICIKCGQCQEVCPFEAIAIQ
ncbi:unnamed protein product, partial [marine sediment metagenome]